MWWKPIKEGVIEVGHNKRKGIKFKAIHQESRVYVGCLTCDLFQVCRKCRKGILKAFICQNLGYPENTTFRKYEDSKEEG